MKEKLFSLLLIIVSVGSVQASFQLKDVRYTARAVLDALKVPKIDVRMINEKDLPRNCYLSVGELKRHFALDRVVMKVSQDRSILTLEDVVFWFVSSWFEYKYR